LNAVPVLVAANAMLGQSICCSVISAVKPGHCSHMEFVRGARDASEINDPAGTEAEVDDSSAHAELRSPIRHGGVLS
jgi:hypothetical protein